MNEITVIPKQRIVNFKEYKTSDGKIFNEDDIDDAYLHQDILNGIKKICPICNGDKTVIKLVDVYPKGFPDSGWAVDMKPREFKCDRCSGRGYLELKFA